MTGIVIGTDGSPSAAAALRWAAREGRLRGLPVTALMAWGYLDQQGEFDPHYGETAVRERLAAAVEATLGADAADAAGDVAQEVVCDLPARALLDASLGSDLVVVGARGLGGFRRLALGSVSDQVLHHATCPVAVVRPSADELENPERIVVGFDGSEGARAAFRWALDEARARQAPVRLVHAWQPAFVGGRFRSHGDSPAMEEVAEHTLQAAVADEGTEGVTVEPLAVCGSAPEALLQEAAGATLVVVGSRGRGGFSGLLLGSVAQQLARHSETPLVVLPHRD